jgi:hypothetical protein
MSDQKPISKNEEKVLHSMMKKFDALATLFFILLCSFVLASIFYNPFSSVQEKEPSLLIKKAAEDDPNRIENGIHVRSGLLVGDGYKLVLNNCGGCHSHKLVIQNHADAQGWTDMIDWMQETQKLWDLGENEAPIVAYLAKYYGAKKKSRRTNLKDIEWYTLD